MDPAVTVSGLTKRYGPKVAVDDLSFHVEQGEIFGLLGPNGSGKTTTVECVQGLRRADGGSIAVFGYDAMRESMRVRRLVGSRPWLDGGWDLGATVLVSSVLVVSLMLVGWRLRRDDTG